MFGLFKKKSHVDKLEAKHKKLLEEAYKLSTTNRKLSDTKTAEANGVLEEIDQLNKRS